MSLWEYLEKARVKELADELTRAGFKVTLEPTIEGRAFDLLAERNDKRRIYEVVAKARLKERAKRIAELRKIALGQQGAEFHLVIVNPPRERDIHVDGLAQALRDYLIEHMPSELDELSGSTIVDDVVDVQIDDIHVTDDGTQVSGGAMVEVTLEYGGGDEKDGMTTSDSYPLTFQVRLNHALKIEAVDELEVDTSSFYE